MKQTKLKALWRPARRLSDQSDHNTDEYGLLDEDDALQVLISIEKVLCFTETKAQYELLTRKAG
jgi:hypothetical protein